MIAVVLGVVLAFAMVLVAFAYTAAQSDAERSAARFAAQTKRVRALSAAVERLSDSLEARAERTDATVVTGARRTMGVLGDAIRREGRVIEASVGRNSKAVAAMGALLEANTKSLAELMSKLSAQDRAALAQVMAKMEARHVEIVSYLSGGGMDKVAAAVTAAAVGTEHFGAEHFSTFNMRTALTGVGVVLDDAALRTLDADLKADVKAGLSLKEAMYMRLARLQPVVVAARAAADRDAKAKAAEAKADDAAKAAAADVARDDAHREAVRAAMAELHALQNAQTGRVLTAVEGGRAETAAGRAETAAGRAATDKSVAELRSALQENLVATKAVQEALQQLRAPAAAT